MLFCYIKLPGQKTSRILTHCFEEVTMKPKRYCKFLRYSLFWISLNETKKILQIFEALNSNYVLYPLQYLQIKNRHTKKRYNETCFCNCKFWVSFLKLVSTRTFSITIVITAIIIIRLLRLDTSVLDTLWVLFLIHNRSI